MDYRYRMMDYLYTAFHQQSLDGSPVVSPLFYKYRKDTNTYPIDQQFLFGSSVLVSPVTEENTTSVTFYLPVDQFYDFKTFAPVEGRGENVTADVPYTDIQLHIAGGSILPLRSKSAMTTKALRKEPFNIVIAPSANGTASGSLYLDDGVSLHQRPGSTTEVTFTWNNNRLRATGVFGFRPAPRVSTVTVLNVSRAPADQTVIVNGHAVRSEDVKYDKSTKSLVLNVDVSLDKAFDLTL